MSKWLKNLALGLVIAFSLIFIFNMFSRPKIVDNRTNLAEQQQIYERQLKESSEQIERSKRIYEQAEILQQRQEKLIEKWEEQAKRVDVILSTIESKKK